MISEWGQPDRSLRSGYHMDFMLHFGPSHYTELYHADNPYFSRKGTGNAKAFIDYYREKRTDTSPSLCMISGELEIPAEQHPKGIVAKYGNAKLISANDSSGFTYRGRFDDPAQAATISYTASQKAHCALRWLVANQGVTFGGRTFLCWNPQGQKVPSMTQSMARPGGEQQRAARSEEHTSELQSQR